MAREIESEADPSKAAISRLRQFDTKKNYFWGTQSQLGKVWLRKRLEQIAPVKVVMGWQTKGFREIFGIRKSHQGDAIAMALDNESWSDNATNYEIIATRHRRDIFNLRHTEYLRLGIGI